MRKIEIEKRELEDLYIQQKLTPYKCGKILHCSAFTISKNLRNFGIPVRDCSQSHKNKLCTEITKGKISKALIGIKRSVETKEKMKNAQLGKKASSKTIKKLSESHKGNIPGNKILIDKKRLQELYIDRKLSLKKCGSFFNCSMTPIKRSLKEFDIHMRNISEANKGCIPWNKNKTGVYSEETLKNILTRRIPSSLEEEFQKVINKYNLSYEYVGNGAFTIGHYNPDFINTNSEKIAVEVYARYYKKRNHISIEKWKKERAKVFAKYGWEIIYFDETEVTEENILVKLGGK